MQPVSGSQMGQNLPVEGLWPCLKKPQLSGPLQHPAGPQPARPRSRGLEAGLSVHARARVFLRECVCVVSGRRAGLADRKGRLWLRRKGWGFGKESKP